MPRGKLPLLLGEPRTPAGGCQKSPHGLHDVIPCTLGCQTLKGATHGDWFYTAILLIQCYEGSTKEKVMD